MSITQEDLDKLREGGHLLGCADEEECTCGYKEVCALIEEIERLRMKVAAGAAWKSLIDGTACKEFSIGTKCGRCLPCLKASIASQQAEIERLKKELEEKE